MHEGGRCVLCGNPTADGFECEECRRSKDRLISRSALLTASNTPVKSSSKRIPALVVAAASVLAIIVLFAANGPKRPSISDTKVEAKPQQLSSSVAINPTASPAVSNGQVAPTITAPPDPSASGSTGGPDFSPVTSDTQPPKSAQAPETTPPAEDPNEAQASIQGAMEHQPAFQALYQQDSSNQAKQSWDEYWDWIQKFYGGSWGVAGWVDTGNGLLAQVTGPRHRSIRDKWDSVGVEVAGEWAKDNSVRRLDTDQVSNFRTAILDAAQQDSGDGSAIEARIDELKGEVDRLVNGR
jgi:hypothetical protein